MKNNAAFFLSVRHCLSKRFARSLMTMALAAVAASANRAAAQCTGFSLSSAHGVSIVPGTTDIGNHCDDCTTNIALPFPVALYGATYSTARVSSNGTLQFTTNDAAYGNGCLPQAATLGVAICPHWDDLMTDGANEGIFTSVSGAAPNRIFNIE